MAIYVAHLECTYPLLGSIETLHHLGPCLAVSPTTAHNENELSPQTPTTHDALSNDTRDPYSSLTRFPQRCFWSSVWVWVRGRELVCPADEFVEEQKS